MRGAVLLLGDGSEYCDTSWLSISPLTPSDLGLYHNSGQFSLPSSLLETSYTVLSIIVSIFDLASSIMIRWERWGKQKIPFPKSPCSEDLWVKRPQRSLPHYVLGRSNPQYHIFNEV
jgi:hypothetical protein